MPLESHDSSNGAPSSKSGGDGGGLAGVLKKLAMPLAAPVILPYKAVTAAADTRPGKAALNALSIPSNIVLSQLGFSDLNDPGADKFSYRFGHNYGIGGKQNLAKTVANVGLSIAADPATYLSGGTSAAAKAAKADLMLTEAGSKLAAKAGVSALSGAERAEGVRAVMAARQGQEGAQFVKPGVLGRLRGKEGLEASAERGIQALSTTGRGGIRIGIPFTDAKATILQGGTLRAAPGAVGDVVRHIPGGGALADATGSALTTARKAASSTFRTRTGFRQLAGSHAADLAGEAHFGAEARAEQSFSALAKPLLDKHKALTSTQRTAVMANLETGAALPDPALAAFADEIRAIMPERAPATPAEQFASRPERLADSLEEKASSLLQQARKAPAGPERDLLEERAADTLSQSKRADADEIVPETAGKAVPAEMARMATPKGRAILEKLQSQGKLPPDLERLLKPTRGADLFEPRLTVAEASESAARLIEKVDPKAAAAWRKDGLDLDIIRPALTRRLAAERAAEQVRGLNDLAWKVKAPDGSEILHMAKDEAPDNFKEVMFGNKAVYVHPEIAGDLEKTAAAVNGDAFTKSVLQTYDKALNFWKASNTVLPLGTGFFARNALGNTVFSVLAGATPANWARGTKVLMAGAGGEGDASKIFKLFKGEGLWAEGAQEADLLKPQLLDTVGESGLKAASRKFSPNQAGRKANSMIENQARMAVFVHGLEKTGSAAEAAILVRKYLFEYRDLSAIEQRLFRRIVPFYTFARKNTELFLRTAVTDPGRLAALNKVLGAAQDQTGVELDLPQYAAADTILTPSTPLSAQNTLFAGGLAGAAKNQMIGRTIPDTKNGGYRTVKPGQGSETRLETGISDLVPALGKYGRIERAKDQLGVGDGPSDLARFFLGIRTTKEQPTAKGNTNASLHKAIGRG